MCRRRTQTCGEEEGRFCVLLLVLDDGVHQRSGRSIPSILSFTVAVSIPCHRAGAEREPRDGRRGGAGGLKRDGGGWSAWGWWGLRTVSAYEERGEVSRIRPWPWE